METAPSNLPWQTYYDRVRKGHYQSDILWQSEKGPPPIRHTLTGWKRAITNQTYHDKKRKGHRQSDILWQGEKGPPPIRHTVTGWERAIINQTYCDRVRKPSPIRHIVTRWERAITNQTYYDSVKKGHHQSDILWQGEKGPSPIRHTVTWQERAITNQTTKGNSETERLSELLYGFSWVCTNFNWTEFNHHVCTTLPTMIEAHGIIQLSTVSPLLCGTPLSGDCPWERSHDLTPGASQSLEMDNYAKAA